MFMRTTAGDRIQGRIGGRATSEEGGQPTNTRQALPTDCQSCRNSPVGLYRREMVAHPPSAQPDKRG